MVERTTRTVRADERAASLNGDDGVLRKERMSARIQDESDIANDDALLAWTAAQRGNVTVWVKLTEKTPRNPISATAISCRALVVQ